MPLCAPGIFCGSHKGIIKLLVVTSEWARARTSSDGGIIKMVILLFTKFCYHKLFSTKNNIYCSSAKEMTFTNEEGANRPMARHPRASIYISASSKKC
jgi:hypothetical protein